MSSIVNRLVDDAHAIFDAAVASVQADRLLRNLKWDEVGVRMPASYDRVVVVGLGKAALAMASVLEDRLGHIISDGSAVVPQGYPASLPGRFTFPSRIHVLEGGHPLPNDGSRRAANRILSLADACGPQDLLIALISGGGSALCAEFKGDISLSDAAETYRLLLTSGADIHEMNAVRKHISIIGGGQLARAALPADVLSLIISDVVGDDPGVIAGGPTAGDSSTYADARRVMEENEIWETAPSSVRRVIEHGIANPSLETPKQDSEVFQRVTNRLVGTNDLALKAAAEDARKRGYHVEVVATGQTGEARALGPRLIDRMLERRGQRPFCLLAGGESTVTVRGSGIGGRNQEMALAAAIALKGVDEKVVFLSAGTDGVDGPTDAAGAWVTPLTIPRARKMGFDARTHLEDNDSYTFFLHAGGLLKTGHTHTNVMDVQVILSNGPPA